MRKFTVFRPIENEEEFFLKDPTVMRRSQNSQDNRVSIDFAYVVFI